MKHLTTLLLTLLVLGGCDSFQKKGTWSCYGEDINYDIGGKTLLNAVASIVTLNLDTEILHTQYGVARAKDFKGEKSDELLERARKYLDSPADRMNDYDKLVVKEINDVYIELEAKKDARTIVLERIIPESSEAKASINYNRFKCSLNL